MTAEQVIRAVQIFRDPLAWFQGLKRCEQRRARRAIARNDTVAIFGLILASLTV